MALLSFGYVLLGNLLAGMVEARGLDPAIGFFHELQPGKASLALDLLEELRHPLVDRTESFASGLRMVVSGFSWPRYDERACWVALAAPQGAARPAPRDR